MTFKKIKEGKEICHGEVISKEDFLDIFNFLVKNCEWYKKVGVGEAESHKKNDRKEKGAL